MRSFFGSTVLVFLGTAIALAAASDDSATSKGPKVTDKVSELSPRITLQTIVIIIIFIFVFVFVFIFIFIFLIISVIGRIDEPDRMTRGRRVIVTWLLRDYFVFMY